MLAGWRYPFDLPDRGYCLAEGEVRPLRPGDLTDRAPVLAIGSNGAPVQLLRKFGSNATIPVTQDCTIGWAIVYSAHVTGYGAVPATMVPAKGAVSMVFVTWLTSNQQALMDQSEGLGARYRHQQVQAGRTTMLGYQSTAGALVLDDGPIRLAEVATSGGPKAKLIQSAVLRRVARQLGYGDDGIGFSQKLAQDAGLRADVNARLATMALPNSD